jgi:cation diffusion facilitator family transporter
MDHCCSKKASELEAMKQKKQAKVLWAVLVINLVMFFIEMYFGLISRSTALMSDGLDMLGDAFVYGFSIFVIARSLKWKTTAALSKALIMCAFGLIVLGKIIYQLLNPAVPVHETMGMIGGLALAANATCFFLLYKFRSQDTNMTSTWLCSRNDIIANIGVLIAAWAVGLTNTIWPDVIVGLIITAIFLSSSFHVLKLALKDLKQEKEKVAA